jgi:hypothetical protein
MSTQQQPAPAAPPSVVLSTFPPAIVHPPIPYNLASYVSLTGIAGATAAFLTAWGENNWHMTAPIAVLAVAAVAALINFFQGRSHQAAALITAIKRDLAALGISVSATPTPPPQ